MGSWHPIVSIQQITPKRLSDAMDYWNSLLPLSERLALASRGELLEPGSFDLQDLVKMQIVSEEEFRDRLDHLAKELQEKTESDGWIRYEDFVYADNFPETVLRAYLTAFLISEGEAFLRVDPLEEETYLSVNGPKRRSTASTGSKIVAIDHGEWKMHLESGRDE
jgi:hypothetical protein